MSIQVLCPFLNWVFGRFVAFVESLISLILTPYQIWFANIFSQPCMLPFYSADCCLCWTELNRRFNTWCICICLFLLLLPVLLASYQETILKYNIIMYDRFPSRIFIALSLISRSLIHFELLFVYSIMLGSNFIFVPVDIQFSEHHLLKRLSFSHCGFEDNLTMYYIWWFISGLYILFHWSTCLFLCQYYMILFNIAL